MKQLGVIDDVWNAEKKVRVLVEEENKKKAILAETVRQTNRLRGLAKRQNSLHGLPRLRPPHRQSRLVRTNSVVGVELGFEERALKDSVNRIADAK